MQLTERIHIVGSGRYGFGLTHPSDSHIYLVDGGAEIALIDAGCGTANDAVLERIVRTGLSPDRIRALFITHAHADHAGGAAKLRAGLGLALMTSPEVAQILRAGDAAAASVDVGKAQGTYEPDFGYEAAPVDRELGDGERVRVGDVEVEVITTPGHSSGHLAFLVHDGGRADLFTGDTLFFGGRIALQNIWDCDLTSHLRSLERLGTHRFDGLFPGHLTFTVSEGERHLQVALDAIARGGIPPVL